MTYRSIISASVALLAIAAATSGLAQPATPPKPDAPAHVTAQGAAIYRLQIGAVRVTALSDGSVPQDLHALLRDVTPAQIDALLDRNFQANPVEASINVFLLEMPGRLVLVDTGSGELFGPGAGGGLIASLKQAGFVPDQVTDVLITHAHSDHSGGLVSDGNRVFDNATIHVGKPDLDFFLDRSNIQRTGYDAQYFDVAEKTLRPYLDAGKVEPLPPTGEVLPGVTATLHPGHTPGSAFYTLRSEGEEIVFVGDIIHSAAVQFPAPATTITYDQNPDEAARVRSGAFAGFAHDRTLIAAPHLPFPGIGHVRADDGAFTWIPVTFTNRAHH
ncbi:metallo-beta-lactamase superfamily protein [Ancylobacter aquaticus]|uniref:Metallo-beta-lactamase superfamily protein n=1 Tax=Ancylobacter aquaticus TaxID=100 RepID=A0A4R1I9Y2_ANCAQ|nr:MBL fold metallo-hydrolase [Ancylobacter aquaticus]TCK31053.1 metallo-beta-lactamase superfamily protein [Ancylobacter aquaticus]